MKRTMLAALAGLALATIAADAGANAAAHEWSMPGAAGGAWLAGPSPIEVDHEELRIDCVDKGGPSCTFVAEYAVHNTSAADVTTRGAFYGTSDAAIALDGKDATLPSSTDLRDLDRLVRGNAPDDSAPVGERTPFEITMAPGARGKLVFRGPLGATFATNPEPYYGFVLPAYMERHPLLHTKSRDPARYEMQYLVHPLRAWAGARTVHVEVRWPRGWDYAKPTLDGAPAFAMSDEGGRRVATCDADGARAGTIGLAFSLGGTTVLHGGPLVGVGGQPEPGDVRLRAGWELAGPDWLTWSVVAETNARDRMLVAGVVDASLPGIMLVWPAIGIGGGPVVGAGPRGAYGGGRVQATLSWPFVSFVVPIDIVAPSFTTGSGPLVTVALMGQLSL